MLVVDASIALTWCFEDEVTAATEAIGDTSIPTAPSSPVCGGSRSPIPCCSPNGAAASTDPVWSSG